MSYSDNITVKLERVLQLVHMYLDNRQRGGAVVFQSSEY